MSKQHRDFVTYVRNGVAINALVAFSHDVYTPETQAEPAKTVEHLTLVYLDPAAASNSIQTGEQLRGSIKTEFSVPPLADGLVNGWKEVFDFDGDPAFQAAVQWREYAAALEKSVIADGHPDLVRIASSENRTEPPSGADIAQAQNAESNTTADKQEQIDNLEKQVEELGASLKDADAAKTSIEAELVEAKARVAELTPKSIDVGVGQPPAPTE